MKIVHVVNSLETGGAEGALVRLVVNDNQNDHTIVSLRKGCGYSKLLKKAGVKTYYFDTYGLKSLLINVIRLRHLVRDLQPDILQSWMYHSNIVALFATIMNSTHSKLFWNIRHSNISLRHDKISLILVIFLGAIITRIMKINVVYCAFNAASAHFRIGYSKEDHRVIGNGYEAYKGSFPHHNFEKRANDELHLCYVARYHPQKNHVKLLKAISKIRKKINVKLTLVGRGCDSSNLELKTLLQQFDLQPNVELKGMMQEPRDLMKICDYTLLVSDYGEGFPNVLGESLSVGRPCIATDVGDTKSILKGCGYIVAKNSLEDLVLKIENAWFDRLNRAKYSALCQRSLNNFEHSLSVHKMISSYISYWKSEIH